MHTIILHKVGGSVMLAIPPAIRCDQPRVLDLSARGGRKLESVPNAIMDEVLAKISPIFE
jgi:hypothetical protein